MFGKLVVYFNSQNYYLCFALVSLDNTCMKENHQLPRAHLVHVALKPVALKAKQLVLWWLGVQGVHVTLKLLVL